MNSTGASTPQSSTPVTGQRTSGGGPSRWAPTSTPCVSFGRRPIPLRSCLGRWSRVREGSVLAAYVHPGTEIQHSFHVSLMAVVNHDVAHHQRLFGEDRKSTRLNSSHVKSSYAVFCLKKKK